nr:odorant receptor 39 [Psyttalia incisi]
MSSVERLACKVIHTLDCPSFGTMESTPTEALPVRVTFFFLYIAGFGIANTERDRKLLNLCLVWSCSTVAIALSVTIVDLYYVWGAFNVIAIWLVNCSRNVIECSVHQNMAYSAVNLLTDLLINLKFFIFMFNRRQYEQLLRAAQESLWSESQLEYGRRVLKQCENQGMFFVTLFATFGQASAISYFVEPILLNIKNNSTDVKTRLFPFKIWFDLPIYETPNFQLFFLMEMFVTYHTCIMYFCFDSYMVLANIFITGQFSILKYRLEELYHEEIIQSETKRCVRSKKLSGLDDSMIPIAREFRDCIKQHQYLINFVEQIENAYTIINLISVLVYSVIICLAGYQLIMVCTRILQRKGQTSGPVRQKN